MEKILLKSKTQWIGWISFLILVSLSLMILFSNYFYLSIITIIPTIYIAWRAPYSWIFSHNDLTVKTIFRTKKYNYKSIKQVDLSFPNARIGHILTFKLSDESKFSIDYQDKYWAEDICNLLLKNQVKVNNKDFVWLKMKDGKYVADHFYPRTGIEIERKKIILNEYL
ncbi:hypothetical protein D3C71_461990 [compost metagenome]